MNGDKAWISQRFSTLGELPISTTSLAWASKGSCTRRSRRAALLSPGCAACRTVPESLKTMRLHAFCATTRRYEDVRSTCTCSYPLKFDQFQEYAAASGTGLESRRYDGWLILAAEECTCPAVASGLAEALRSSADHVALRPVFLGKMSRVCRAKVECPDVSDPS